MSYQSALFWEGEARRRGFCRALFAALTPADAALFGGGARALLLCALPYGGPRDASGGGAPPLEGGPFGEVAPFARFNYYREAAARLKTLAADLRRAFPGYPKSAFRLFCNGRLDEKRLAAAYGLGARGKNGLILTREAGSRFVIAGMSLPFAPAGPSSGGAAMPDFALCAGCPAVPPCVRACPTGALSGAHGAFDRAACIQHYASGHGDAVPAPVRAAWGRRLYGCVDCQDACPRNRGAQAAAQTARGRLPRFIDLPALLALDDAALKAFFHGSALGMSWLGPAAIRRNIRCCLGGPV